MTAPAPMAMRAFRFALDPTTDQQHALARHFGAARWAFNHALAQKVDAHRRWRHQVDDLVAAGAAEADARASVRTLVPTKPGIQAELNRTKGDDRTGVDGICPWWHTVSTYAFQSAMADADAAWRNWLASLTSGRAGRRVGYPRFKKKGICRASVRIHHDVNRPTIRLAGYRHLVVPRIGSLRTHDSGKRLARYLDRTGGRIQSVTLSRSGHRWYAAVLVAAPATEPAQPTQAQQANGLVGVDLGVARLVTLSTGLDASYANPRHLQAGQRRLRGAQRALVRTQNGSARRVKAIGRVGRLHHQIAEQRAGTLHQITKTLTTQHIGVAIEDLNVAGMTRSARGTLEQPGRRVRQKAGLNRAILDAGFGEFRRQLTYKTGWYGSTLHVVDRFLPSSKTCSVCGAVKPKLPLAERTYHCNTCGQTLDRDLNAAIVIAAAAHHVADDTSETRNGRRDHVRPPLTGRQRSTKRQDPSHLGPPRRSNPAALPASA